MLKTRRISGFGVGLIVVFTSTTMLAACSSGAPDLTPLPEPEEASAIETESPSGGPLVVSAAPGDTESALKYSEHAIDVYYGVEAEVVGDHPADVSKVELIARGVAASSIVAAAQSVIDSGAKRSGELLFLADVARTKVDVSNEGDNAGVEFGVVDWWGCLEGPDVLIVNSDGSTASYEDEVGIRSQSIWIRAEYFPSESAWFITDFVLDPVGGVVCGNP